VENKFNNETPIKSNYTKFHKDVLIESEILNDINVIHLSKYKFCKIHYLIAIINNNDNIK